MVVGWILGSKKGGRRNDISGNGSIGDEAFQGVSPDNSWMSLAQVINNPGSMLILY